jgi:hypothetical protein
MNSRWRSLAVMRIEYFEPLQPGHPLPLLKYTPVTSGVPGGVATRDTETSYDQFLPAEFFQ